MFILLVGLILSSIAHSHDHLNLEHGIPLEVEDAYVTSYRNRELHSYLLYERTAKDEDLYTLVPRLEFGIARNLQVEIATPIEFGSIKDEKQGNIIIGGLYNFNMETLYLPAISLGADLNFDTGKGQEGIDTTMKLNLTKTLPASIIFHRLHANIHSTVNGSAKKGERDDLMKYILGYQTRWGTDSMIVSDYVYEEEMMKDKEIQLLEVGIRHQYNPLTVIAAGVGAGLNNESPDFRVNVSFQHALNLFY